MHATDLSRKSFRLFGEFMLDPHSWHGLSIILAAAADCLQAVATEKRRWRCSNWHHVRVRANRSSVLPIIVMVDLGIDLAS
jgi:hypothetical protein